MSDVQSRERSTETASGPQREPDERVREALEFADLFDGSEQNVKFSGMAKALKQLAAEVLRLRTEVAEYRNKWGDALAQVGTEAALAASKEPPDLHPRSRETAAESLSVDTSVADLLRESREVARKYCAGLAQAIGYARLNIMDEPELAAKLRADEYQRDYDRACALLVDLDAAMSADVRSQAN